MVMTVMILTQSVDYCQTHCVPGWPATSSSGSHCHPALLLPLLHLDVVYVHHHNNLCPVKFLVAVHNTVSLAWSNPNWFIKNVFKTAVKIFSHSHWEGLLFITVYQLNPNSSFMLQTPGKTILSSLSIIHGTHSSQQAPLASNIVALRVGYTASWVASWASNAINSCTMFASHNNFPASQSPSHPFPLTLQSVCSLPLSSLWVLQHLNSRFLSHLSYAPSDRLLQGNRSPWTALALGHSHKAGSNWPQDKINCSGSVSKKKTTIWNVWKKKNIFWGKFWPNSALHRKGGWGCFDGKTCMIIMQQKSVPFSFQLMIGVKHQYKRPSPIRAPCCADNKADMIS